MKALNISPGEWTGDPEGLVAVSIEDGNGAVVCDVHGASDDPLCEANVQAIAALPKLLRALEGLFEWAHMMGGWEGKAWKEAQDALLAAGYTDIHPL